MSYSFIRHLQTINQALDIMCNHLDSEQSEFRYKVSMARDSLRGVEDTYHEVLKRDAEDSHTYTKPTVVEKN